MVKILQKRLLPADLRSDGRGAKVTTANIAIPFAGEAQA